MNGLVALAVVLCLVAPGLAEPVLPAEEEPGLEDSGTAPELVVTATRRPLATFDVAATAVRLDEELITEERAARSLPEAFRGEPGVMMQKTSNGQTSPYLRGLTGFRTLLVVDGIRLNNSTFREGPNQYWSLVDVLTVSSLEMVGGPSSVLYGSDAVGGTVNARLRSAEARDQGAWFGGRIYGRIATAESSGAARLEGTAGHGDEVRVLAGVTARTFGDIEAGRHVGSLSNTGYDEGAADLRVDWRATDSLDLAFGWQRMRQKDVPRTHSTRFSVSWRDTDVGSDEQRDYDQERDLLYLRGSLEIRDSFVDRVEATLSYQAMGEEQDRIRSSGRNDVSGFDVGTLGIAAQAESTTGIGVWTYGLEWYHDDVSSYARRIRTDGTVAEQIQGPVADDATYDLLGIYVQDEVDVAPWLTLVAGARFTYAAAAADKVADPVTGEKTSFDDSWTNVVGSVRLVARPDDRWRIHGGLSQGFRSPNLSDLTRLDTARSNEIETPSTDLEPEDFVSLELGVRARYDGFRIEASAYHTEMSDLITRYPTGRVIDGENEVQKANAGDGWVHGLEVRAEVDVIGGWRILGGLSLIDGEADVYATFDMEKEREPLSRLPPAAGFLAVRWDHATGVAWAELRGDFADNQDDLSTRDQADTQRIPPGGTPGYAVYHLRGGVRVSDELRLFAAIENILDHDHRIHGSGQNMPGRNLIVGFDLRF